MIGLVGAREMRHDEVEREVVEQVVALRERSDVGRAKAEPVHAGIQMQQRAALAAPTLDLLERVQHGPCLDLARARPRCPRARPRTRRSPLGRQRAQLARLGERRDEESAATLAQQAARDALDAEPIGIGLDDGGTIAGLRALAEHAEVARQSVEIDAQRSRPREAAAQST